MDRSPRAMAAVLTDGREMQAPHLGLIDAAFEQVAAGIPTRLLLTMPPRHGKSRRAARWAPLWYLRRRTEHRVMIASYSSDLADDHGRWIRDAILNYQSRLGISLRPGSSAANRFALTGTEGGAVMAGVGGGLTGKGAHLAVVDDPIKGAAEASSPTMRKRLWEWWQTVLLTRIEPGGSVILIQTRWDEDDRAGRVLADEGRPVDRHRCARRRSLRRRRPSAWNASPCVTRRSMGSLTSGSGLCHRSPPSGWRSSGFAMSWSRRRMFVLCRTVQGRTHHTDRVAELNRVQGAAATYAGQPPLVCSGDLLVCTRTRAVADRVPSRHQPMVRRSRAA